ncbi:nucleotide triphosphate diphosphatase NUDT15 [Streptomyces sp. DT24]|uniref:nucleotide triphosphate diphosphatase NUDT15 n=1 Tax=unclassified Streptomyces TaxID=2593676 RepID=UPI0023BA0771|nr:NUDIX domain-containing protein [Streptomyces sp. AM 4-1-1]WEH36676.1 NUDIX domain-containing protein [Streptomyces sp. AM 4-1-1]
MDSETAPRAIITSKPRDARPPLPHATLGVGVIVLDERGRVLLGRHRGGTWELPGGKVDPTNESVAAAAVRELREETGLEAREEDVRVLAMLHDVIAGLTRVSMAVVVSAWTGEPEVTEPELISGWWWTSPDELPSPLFEPSAQVLATWRPDLPIEHPPVHRLPLTGPPVLTSPLG